MTARSLNSSLRGLVLRFRENDDDPYERDDQNNIVEEDGEQVLKEGWQYDDDGKPVREDDPDVDDDEDDNEKRIAALEKSLADERKLRRKIERDAKRNARKKQSDKKEGDDAELQKQLDASNARSEKLAQGLLRREVDSAIMEEARRQGFIDPSDAVTDEIRREIDADQDEDDPSDIDIDVDSVKDAVKDLASRKQHLVNKGTSSTKSGSRFGGKKTKDDEKATNDTLTTHYPSLR